MKSLHERAHKALERTCYYSPPDQKLCSLFLHELTSQVVNSRPNPTTSPDPAMATNFISTGLSGAVFGSALLLSGVYSPTIILAQLELSDFYMLKVFLTASGSSA